MFGFDNQWCLHMIPALLSAFAFTTAALASFWCETVKFVPSEDTPNSLPSLHFGIWYQRQTEVESIEVGDNVRVVVRNTCVDYPGSIDIDSSWKTARAFSVMALLIGGLVTFALVLAPCAYSYAGKGRWQSLAIFCLVVLPLFQGLTFLLFQSDACLENPVVSNIRNTEDQQQGLDFYPDECEWDAGSSANVSAAVLWFVAGLAMLAVGAPRRPERPPPETQQVTYQHTENLDGTATVAETAVVKGTAISTEDPHSAVTE
jgi:hypothetical protein